MVNPWPLRVGVTFFEKAESNLKLCIMNKRMRNLQNVICFVVGIFFFFLGWKQAGTQELSHFSYKKVPEVL